MQILSSIINKRPHSSYLGTVVALSLSLSLSLSLLSFFLFLSLFLTTLFYKYSNKLAARVSLPVPLSGPVGFFVYGMNY